MKFGFSLLSARFCMAAAALGAGVAAAQEYPSHPIKLVVSFAAGGSTDIAGRLVAKHLGDKLGQSVYVENRPGANATIGVAAVAKSSADGYTLLIQDIVPAGRIFNKGLSYDVESDFDPIAGIFRGPYGLGVNTVVPAKTMKEFVAYANANPGKLNYGHSSATARLVMELFKENAHLNIVGIPYKGNAQVMTALMTNEVQAMFTLPGAMSSLVKDGKARVLAIAGEQRLPQMRDVPTFAELGLPNVKASANVGLWAPAGIPAGAVGRLNAATNDILKAPEIATFINSEGTIVLGGSPADLRRYFREEFDFWSEAARIAKYVPE